MTSNRIIRIVAAAVAVPLVSAAAAADDAYFRTPSKNIHCAYDDYSGKGQVRCDISAFTPSFRTRPADCDLEWGDSFEVTADGDKGHLVCHGDTVISPDARTLGYGQTFARGGIACVSEQTGLTCRNGRGHGFSISKAKQKIF